MPATEDTMTKTEKTGKAETTRKFSTEKHGGLLLRAMREFAEDNPEWKDPTKLGYGIVFAKWVNARREFAPWVASPSIWKVRANHARYRYSAAGKRHADQVARVQVLRRKLGLKVSDVWEVIGGVRSAAAGQFGVDCPWADGVLARLAAFFEVPIEHLRDGAPLAVASPAPPPPAAPPGLPIQQNLPVLPRGLPVKAAEHASVDPAPAERGARVRRRSQWDADHAGDVLDELEQLARAGKGVNNKALAAYLDHARARKPISDITESILAGTSRE
jgi:hypothetical protein